MVSVTHVENGPRHIRVFDVQGERITNGRLFATCTNGMFDGFRIDEAGRLWTSAADGIHGYDPDGTRIAMIRVPEIVANVCFGGYYRNRLFICATTSVYADYTLARGAKTFWRLNAARGIPASRQ